MVRKRNGKLEKFNIHKLLNAVTRAYVATRETEPPATLLNDVREWAERERPDDVEDIQDGLETLLMDGKYHDVAKAFILYRSQHAEDRETLSQIGFINDYCEAANPATGSKYDANANVETKNVATLIGELPKKGFIRINRMNLVNRMKEMYGKETADRYLDLLNHHFIYKNDETCLANYCASITMYPWLLNGTRDIGGNSTAPTNLKAFCGGFVNMVFIVSSMLSGACATPEFLMYMDYFIRKEYGDDYWERADEIVDLSLRKRTLDKVITDCFEQVVYSINQPTGARNFQAVFWNISYYDKPYFDSLFGDFRFPDGSEPSWEGTRWLQKRFMKWFNAERLKTVLTFPVKFAA